jgi:hypothetical protein
MVVRKGVGPVPDIRVIDLDPAEEDEILAVMKGHGWRDDFGAPDLYFYKWDAAVAAIDDVVIEEHTYFDWNYRYRSYLEIIKNEVGAPLRDKISTFLEPRDEVFRRGTKEVGKPLVPEIKEFAHPNWWLYRVPINTHRTYRQQGPVDGGSTERPLS